MLRYRTTNIQKFNAKVKYFDDYFCITFDRTAYEATEPTEPTGATDSVVILSRRRRISMQAD